MKRGLKNFLRATLTPVQEKEDGRKKKCGGFWNQRAQRIR
jgi:hypothetical protein